MMVPLDEGEQQAEGQEGEGLGAQAPVLQPHRRPQQQRQDADTDAIARGADPENGGIAGGDDEGVDEDGKRYATPRHELGQDDLHEPGLIDPGLSSLGVGKEIDLGNCAVGKGDLSGAYMPPKVVGVDGGDIEADEQAQRHHQQPKDAEGQTVLWGGWL